MPEKKQADPKPIDGVQIQESARMFDAKGLPVAQRLDRENRVVKDVVIFAPEPVGNGLYKSANGYYDESFFESAIKVLEGAHSFPRHAQPILNSQGKVVGYEERDPTESMGRYHGIVREGDKLVARQWKLFKKRAGEIMDLIEESWDGMALSMCGAPVGYRHKEFGPVFTGFDTSEKRKPTVDLVDAGGATKNIFESAPQRNTQQSTTQETETMETEAINKIVSEASKATETRIMESLKPRLDEVNVLTEKNRKLERELKIREAVGKSGLKDGDLTAAIRTALDASAEDKWDAILKERKDELASRQQVIRENGGSRSDETPKKSEVKLGSALGLHTVIREIAGGKGFDKDAAPEKRRTFNQKWNEHFAAVLDRSDNSEPTRKLRTQLREQYMRVGIKNLFGECYGFSPSSLDDIPVLIREVTPVDSSGFTTVNQSILASVMIEAYNIMSNVGDQLVTPYPTAKEIETVEGFTAPAGDASFTEGNAPPDATITPKYVQLQKLTKKYGAVVSVTREAVLYDQTGQLLDRANRITQKIGRKRQKAILFAIADSAGASDTGNNEYYSYYPSNLRSSFWVGANTQESNLFTDWTNVDVAVQRLRAQKDENNDILEDNAMTPLEVLIPDVLVEKANRIFGAELNEIRTSSAANIQRFANPYRGVVVYASSILTGLSPTTWYIGGAGAFKKTFLNKETIKFEIVPLPPSDISATLKDLVAGVKCEFLEKTHARDNKGIVRNTSGAMS